jgi:hypothetical protein
MSTRRVSLHLYIRYRKKEKEKKKKSHLLWRHCNFVQISKFPSLFLVYMSTNVWRMFSLMLSWVLRKEGLHEYKFLEDVFPDAKCYLTNIIVEELGVEKRRQWSEGAI